MNWLSFWNAVYLVFESRFSIVTNEINYFQIKLFLDQVDGLSFKKQSYIGAPISRKV